VSPAYVTKPHGGRGREPHCIVPKPVKSIGSKWWAKAIKGPQTSGLLPSVRTAGMRNYRTFPDGDVNASDRP